jgi:membrane peptidoglycan carboxypeptidase
VAKKPTKSRNMNVYSNLAHKRRTKKDALARKKAEYLATLPKHPLLRNLYRLHPKRLWGYWFSKQGAIMALKIAGVGILFAVLLIGALFAYYRKDLDAIRPGELAKRVQTTVTTYYARDGKTVLWEDKGDGNYKLVVDGSQISKSMKQATVAIEDKDFYHHIGVSPTSLMRAFLNNAGGGSVQGGSTLTQQLVKQVYFADEAQHRGLSGIPRKIKELILSVEVERMYNKEQILDLYLNESPYGGRRNGVESGAQTYFGKSAKDLTLPEAAMLAAIPNQPGLYYPYNPLGHTPLIERQHKVLDTMVEMNSITKAQADEAKAYPILDHIIPEKDQYKDVQAPHFVQMVRSQLEQELGKATVGQGGLSIVTTLDLNVQHKLEEAMTKMFNSSTPNIAGFTNGAATVEDNKTGQIIALLGSRGFDYGGFGQDNAAIAYIQPGSSVKPLVYSELFKQKPTGKQNYGSGSVLADENIDSIYGGHLQNADQTYKGNLTIRQSLAQSRNIPAVKAMYISGVQPTLQTIRDLGDASYCTQGVEAQAGLSSAIGGCTTRQTDHVNAFASLARMGAYKPQASVLEVKNSQGQVIKKWQDQSKQVLDPQIAYIISDILNDANARRPLMGNFTTGLSYGDTGIRTSTKTGTSDTGGKAKDLWMMTYSPVVSMGVWLGNPDTSTLKNGSSVLPGPIIDSVMRYVHQEVYGPAGQWKPGDWFTAPAGIQNINGELYPSWYKKSQGSSTSKMTFDRVSKKKATSCTPDAAKIDIDVSQTVDPITKKSVVMPADGSYDATADDDIHKCDDVKPTVNSVTPTQAGNKNDFTINVSVAKGSAALAVIDISVNGVSVGSIPVTDSGSYSLAYTATAQGAQTVAATVRDSSYYTGTNSTNYNFTYK